MIAAAGVAYLVLVLAIGAWAATRTRTARDFFIAGQRLGLVVTGLAAMSAAFSGFVFVGGPGLAYTMGLASLWIVLPVSFTAGLLCWVVARPLRRLAGIREVLTVPDAIACRYGSRTAAGLAAVAVATGSVAYLATQLLALGVVTRAVFGLDSLTAAIAIGALVVLAYSAAGGMVAGVYTDVLQGLLMIAAAAAVFAAALAATGGWSAMTRSIADSERFGPAFLEPLGGAPALTAFGFFFVFGVGVLGQPHMLHKFYMLRDPAALRFMPAVLAAGQALCLLLWLGIGLAVPALVATGAMAAPGRPDDAAPQFLLAWAPQAVAALAFVAVLAAIMSTADSFLNIGSAALVRDLPRALGRPLRGELAWGRIAVVGVTMLSAAAAGAAHAAGDRIALVGTLAFGTFAATLAPALAIGLNWSRVPAAAATASMAAGLIVNLGLELWRRAPGLPWPFRPGVVPSALALAFSFIVLFAVTWWAPAAASALDEDVRAVVEEA